MWDEMVKSYCGGVEPELSQCMYVGDAAGRVKGWKAGAQKDFSDSDRYIYISTICDMNSIINSGFAHNVGIKFLTPEEFFLAEPKTTQFAWHSIDPQALLDKGKLFVVPAH